MKNLSKALAALLLFALPVAAQEGQGPLPQRGGGQSEQVEELKRLFLEVEAELARIDELLADAGAGETSLAEVEDAGIDDILDLSLSGSAGVQSKIGRILEIAQDLSSQSQGGGGQQGEQQPGESPLDQERDRGPQQRENTPEAPEREGEDDESQEQPGEEQPEGEEENPGGEDPRSNQDSDMEGENRSAEEPGQEAGEAVPHGDEADKWGQLPARQREIFRNQGRDELPVQYRDWIDAYYRRLSKADR